MTSRQKGLIMDRTWTVEWEECEMDNNVLAGKLIHEACAYCVELDIDTALGFEFAREFARSHDLAAKWVELGEDGYNDWISDAITDYFEEEEQNG